MPNPIAAAALAAGIANINSNLTTGANEKTLAWLRLISKQDLSRLIGA